MKIKNFILFICSVFFYHNITFCQESFDFQYTDIEVTIFPTEPGVCPNSSADVTCIETFESYKWEMINPHPQYTILYGQSQDLVYPGEYLLTVEKYVNDKLCSEQILFEVHDLKNPEGIENYFINNGFYPVPIIINQVELKSSGSGSRMSCDFEGIKFSSEFEYVDLNVDGLISDIINNFEPFDNEDYDAIAVKSKNSCLCDLGIDDLENDFHSNPLSIWTHLFSESEDDTYGKLYIKGLLPFEGETPINEGHKNHLESIHDEIINNAQNNADPIKATLEHLRIIILNIFMPNPTSGYQLETQCEVSEDDIGDDHVFTPGGVAVRLPAGASDIFIENDLASRAYGSMLKFSTGIKYWQNYHRNEDIWVSNGYFNPINAEIYQTFTTTISDCTSCVMDVVSIVQGCTNFSCSIDLDQYTTQYFDLNSVMNGGLNYAISSCNSIWSLWPVTKRASKKLIYDLLCAIKNGDSTFEFVDKFKGKVIFAKDIILADLQFDFVGVTMPKDGNSIDLLDTPLSNNNGIPIGFIHSFEISTDSEIRLNFLKLGLEGGSEEETEALSNTCKSTLKAAYTHQKWGEVSALIKSCLQYYNISEKNKLLDYLDPPDKDNLLILVNGYRIALSPGKKWYKGGAEFPTKEPVDAVNTCYDNFEGGGYWGEAGANFAKRINNNVLYLDGHHSITTSNHLLMATDNLSETSFLKSVLSCLPSKFLCLESICGLNDIPNGPGFYARYWSGREAAWLIWEKMVAGDINIALSEDKTQITGKVDIVAHSMGYASSKGMIDVLTDKLAPGNTFGNYYIVAPENATAYTDEEFENYSPEIQQDFMVDLNLFESVFQYGSDFTPNGDKKCKQDGVAPQKRVRGLPDDNINNVFIPDSEEKIKSFVNAHLMENYGWLFNILSEDDGYIKPRN